ncbi:hypothetical protein L7F22_019540 [Adiantum nelumboides]|nr:hypothetical protein [Adiantum nelumboides]
MTPQLSSPLLAVLLVTSSSRGPSLNFRFPRRPRLEKRYSKVRYLVAKHESQKDSEPSSRRQSRRSSSNVISKDHAGGVDLQDDEMNDDFDAGSALSEDFDEGSISDSSSSEEEGDGVDLDGTTDDDNHSNFDPVPVSSTRKEDIEVASSVGGTSAATKEAAATVEAAEHARRRKRAYEQYLGYDCETLASLLAPKRELCHQKFELVIDDLAFVGHPVCVGKDGKWDPEGTSSDEESRGRDNTRRGSASGYRIESPNQSNTHAESSSHSKVANPMTLFHFVLVLDRPDPSPDLPALDLTSWLQIFYDNIAFKMTAALFAEEIRCQYVSQECDKIGALRERCMDDGQSYSSFLTHANHTSSLAKSIQQVYSSISLSSNAFVTVNESIEAHLQLPPMLHEPSKMMKMADIETPIDINDAIFTNATAIKDGLILPSRPINADQLMHEEWSRTTGPFLLPWKTLLLLREHHENGRPDDPDDASELSAFADKGIEAWARKFTTLMKPTLDGVPTLADSADLLGWNLEEDVYPMVRHLIYYREARVIDVPRIQNYYAVSPLFDLAELGKLSTSWSIKFLTLPPLPSFLATLSSALKPFSMQINRRDQRQLCLDALIWLLRHEIVVQMHVRLRLVANESCKRKAAIAREEERERIRKKRALITERRKKEQLKADVIDNTPSSFLSSLFNADVSQSAPVFGGGRDGSINMAKEDRGRTRDRSLSPHAEEILKTSAAPTEIIPSALSATRPDGKPNGASPSSPKPTDLLALKMGNNPSSSNVTSTTIPITEDVPAFYKGDELRFERRPVLRSRSPSRVLGFTPSNGGAPSSFGTHRSGNGSRPSTPRGRGRLLSHSRESSLQQIAVGLGEGTSALRISSIGAKGTEDAMIESAPSGPVNSTNISSRGTGKDLQIANRIDRRKRSPSQARLRVTGFGDDEEVYMDESKKVEEKVSTQKGQIDRRDDGEKGVDLARRSRPRSSGSQDERRSLREDFRRLSLVGEEKDAEAEKDPDITAKENTAKQDEIDDSEDDELYLNYDIEFEQWETRPIASIIAEPSRASGDENEWIAAMVEGKEVWQRERMYKLLPFLNGKHTVDEIVYRLEWRRKDLRAVLAAFREDILTFVHP